MRSLKFLFLFFALVIPALGISQNPGPADTRKKLIGKHWAGSCNSTNCDTMTYNALKKYDEKNYQWGSGYGEGFEFFANDSATTFHNVLCSDESSPVDNFQSRWTVQNDTLVADGYYSRMTYRIVRVNRKKLELLVLNYEPKNGNDYSTTTFPPPRICVVETSL